MNVLEAAAAIVKHWDEHGGVNERLIAALREAHADELRANEPPAATGFQRDQQHDARQRVARWGRSSSNGKFRFVRSCDNDLAFYVFHGKKHVSLTIDEDGEAVIVCSDPEAVSTHYADIAKLMQALGRLVP